MKHDPHSLTSLIRDDEFIDWVLKPDSVKDEKWQRFLDKYPSKFKTVQSARDYVLILARDTGRHMPTVEQSKKMWEMVEKSTHGDSRKLDKPDSG